VKEVISSGNTKFYLVKLPLVRMRVVKIWCVIRKPQSSKNLSN